MLRIISFSSLKTETKRIENVLWNSTTFSEIQLRGSQFGPSGVATVATFLRKEHFTKEQ